MTLAAESAKLGVWVRDLERNEIWANDQWRSLFGFASSERLELATVLQRLQPDDRELFNQTLANALERGSGYDTEYRIVLPDGEMRWIAAHGRVQSNSRGKPILVRGVSLDITARKLAEHDLHERRGELAHLSRVTMLGELSGSLAHELNQPLTAILCNAQAAEQYLAEETPNLAQVREILADIVAEDERAGKIIRRLRLLLKKGEVEFQMLDANEIVSEVLKLARSDLVNHGVTVEAVFARDLGAIPHQVDEHPQRLLIGHVRCHALQHVYGVGNGVNDVVLRGGGRHGKAQLCHEQFHRPYVDSDAQPIGVDPAQVKLPAFLPDTPEIRKDWAEYLNGIQLADAEVGRAMKELKAGGELDDTLVIVMAGDHGPAFQHGKMTPYELGLHVPLIVRARRCPRPAE